MWKVIFKNGNDMHTMHFDRIENANLWQIAMEAAYPKGHAVGAGSVPDMAPELVGCLS